MIGGLCSSICGGALSGFFSVSMDAVMLQGLRNDSISSYACRHGEHSQCSSLLRSVVCFVLEPVFYIIFLKP